MDEGVGEKGAVAVSEAVGVGESVEELEGVSVGLLAAVKVGV